MSIQIEIPDHIVQAIRLLVDEQKQQLLVELAVALYTRGIPRHYQVDDLQDDITYANH